MSSSNSYRVAIIGGGTAGISLAARLRRAGTADIGVIEPAESHFYQPLRTLVGGGCAQAAESRRSEASVMPRAVGWVKDHAEEVDPGAQTVTTRSGTSVHYDHLVVCPGIHLDWAAVPGIAGVDRHCSGLEQLSIRTCAEDLAVDQANAFRHSSVHHAVRADQVRRRSAENRLPRG